MQLLQKVVFLGAVCLALGGVRGADSDTKSMPSVPGASAVAYDCAANAMYVLARVSNVRISYSKCTEMLPVVANGNTGLEVKKAMEQAGFHVAALRMKAEELARLKAPAIVLAYPEVFGVEAKQIGHYFVVHPLSPDFVQVLDPLRDRRIVERTKWAAYLKANAKLQVIALVCSEEAQQHGQLLMDETPTGLVAGGHREQQYESEIVVGGSDKERLQRVVWDCGEVVEGEVVAKTFVLRNGSSRAIAVKNIISSCSCTAGKANETVIPVGGTGTVELRVNLSGKVGPLEEGSVVFFRQGDGVPPIDLRIRGICNYQWAATPGMLDFGRCSPGQGDKVMTSVVRSNRTSGETSLELVMPSLVGVKGELTKIDKAGYRLTVTLDTNVCLGSVRTSILGKDAGNKTFVLCEVMGEMAQGLEIDRPRMFLTSQTGECRLRISERSGQPIAMTLFESDGYPSDFTACTTGDGGRPGELEVTVRLTDKAVGFFKGKALIRIARNGAANEKIEVPLVGWAGDRSISAKK